MKTGAVTLSSPLKNQPRRPHKSSFPRRACPVPRYGGDHCITPTTVIPNAAKRSEESRISRYRSRGIRNTFYFLPLPAISAPSAVSPDAPGIDKQERLYSTFHMRSPISQLYNNVKNAPECPRMPHFSKNSPDSQVLALPRLTPPNHSSEPPSAAAHLEASECGNVKGRGVNMPMNRLPDRPELARLL